MRFSYLLNKLIAEIKSRLVMKFTDIRIFIFKWLISSGERISTS